MCLIQLIYMINVQPFQSQSMNYIETFNEMSIYLANLLVTCFLDPTHNMDFMNYIGWALIFNASLNILVNMLLLCATSIRDLCRIIIYYHNKSQRDERIDQKADNFQVLIDQAPEEFDDLKTLLHEVEVRKFCFEWLPDRQWLRANKIEFDDYPNEIKF